MRETLSTIGGSISWGAHSGERLAALGKTGYADPDVPAVLVRVPERNHQLMHMETGTRILIFLFLKVFYFIIF